MIRQYKSTTWINGASGNTPLNSTNLNNIESGIENLVADTTALEGTVGANTVNITSNTNRIKAVEDVVGSESSGLVQRVGLLEKNSATTVALDSAVTRIGNIESTYPNTYETKTDADAAEARLNKKIDDGDNSIRTDLSTLEQKVNSLEAASGGSGDVTWAQVKGKPETFNPQAHTTTDSTKYGAATSELYGHVKISNADVSSVDAEDGLAAGMDHTHSNYATKTAATQSTAGLLSSSDKKKLDGIEANANKYVLPDIINKSKVETTGTTVAFSIDGKEFSQVVAVDGGSLSVGSADKLTSARTISLTGDVSGSATFDGTANATITATVADNSHNHNASNITDGTLDPARIPTGTSSTTVALGNHTHSSYVNQNAFSKIAVSGQSDVSAESATDTLTLVAGDNVTITTDATNNKVTIAATDTKYTFTNKAETLSWGTTSTIATVGGTDITVKLPSNPNTNYTTKLFATGSTGTAHAATTNGNTYLRLFDNTTARQSIKITGSGATSVTSDANGVITISSTDNNTNTAHSHQAGAGLTISGTGGTSGTTTYSANLNSTTSLGTIGTTNKLYAVGVDANGQLCVNVPWTDNNTTYTFNGAVSTIKDDNLTASRALISNSNGKVAVSAVTSTELGYLDGVTSSIQTQLNSITSNLSTNYLKAKKVTELPASPDADTVYFLV